MSLFSEEELGPFGEEKKPFSYHSVAGVSRSAEWPTPDEIIQHLAREFCPSGSFDLDPCCTKESAKAPKFYTRKDNGLLQEWHGNVYMNPPYGRTGREAGDRGIVTWMEKAVHEVKVGNARCVVCLVPARVDTKWWREAVEAATLVRIWPGRIKWRNDQPAPFANAVIAFGQVPPGEHTRGHKICTEWDCYSKSGITQTVTLRQG